jgi:hypothetical protein
MRVLAVDYRRFRGFLNRGIRPRGHVVLVGEPRAGRSDALDGLARVLGGGGGRLPDPDELDFHDRDTSRRAEVEVVLAELGTALEQMFLDELEFWDTEEEELIEELEDPGELDGESVLTVCASAIGSSGTMTRGFRVTGSTSRRAPTLTRASFVA